MKQSVQQDVPIRVRTPKGKEQIGYVEQLMGFAKFRVRCSDGKVRLCRVPGKLRRRLWIRANDYVLVKPWDVQSDERGDVLYKYNPTQVSWLKKRGFLKSFEINL